MTGVQHLVCAGAYAPRPMEVYSLKPASVAISLMNVIFVAKKALAAYLTLGRLFLVRVCLNVRSYGRDAAC